MSYPEPWPESPEQVPSQPAHHNVEPISASCAICCIEFVNCLIHRLDDLLASDSYLITNNTIVLVIFYLPLKILITL